MPRTAPCTYVSIELLCIQLFIICGNFWCLCCWCTSYAWQADIVFTDKRGQQKVTLYQILLIELAGVSRGLKFQFKLTFFLFMQEPTSNQLIKNHFIFMNFMIMTEPFCQKVFQFLQVVTTFQIHLVNSILCVQQCKLTGIAKQTITKHYSRCSCTRAVLQKSHG